LGDLERRRLPGPDRLVAPFADLATDALVQPRLLDRLADQLRRLSPREPFDDGADERVPKLRIETRDEIGRVVDQRAELLLAGSELLFGALALGDVGVGAEPARDLAVVPGDGHRTAEVPAEFAVVSPQRKRVLPRFAAFEMGLKLREHGR